MVLLQKIKLVEDIEEKDRQFYKTIPIEIKKEYGETWESIDQLKEYQA